MERNSHGTFSTQAIPIRNLDDQPVAFVLNQILQRRSSLIDLLMDERDELCLLVVDETYGNTFLMTEFLHWLYSNGLL